VDVVERERRLARERARIAPKLAKGREQAARKMAAEHVRVERHLAVLAEDAAFAAAVPAAGVVGPDGRAVTVELTGTGMPRHFEPVLGGPVEVAVTATVLTSCLLVHRVVWRGGWTVHVRAKGHRALRLRCASREEARSRAVAVAELVRQSGTSALAGL